MILIIDPGIKTFALTYINKDKPVYFCYNPYISELQVNCDSIINFIKIAKIYLNYVDTLIIERYVATRITKGISPERMNLSIFSFILSGIEDYKKVFPVTNSWKRMIKINDKYIKYDLVIDYAKNLGYMKYDKHFLDCMLMYSINNKIPFPVLFKNGLPVYKKLKYKKVI